MPAVAMAGEKDNSAMSICVGNSSEEETIDPSVQVSDESLEQSCNQVVLKIPSNLIIAF